jgi:hypothetical protein
LHNKDIVVFAMCKFIVFLLLVAVNIILLSLLHLLLLLLLLPHLSQTPEIFENNILIKGIFGESNNPLGVRAVSCF